MDKTDLKVYLHAKPVITRRDIQEARLLKDETNGDIIIELTLTAKGAERLSEATSQNQNKLLAILINGRVIAAPRIFATLSNSFQIMGNNFTAAEASELCEVCAPQPHEWSLRGAPRVFEDAPWLSPVPRGADWCVFDASYGSRAVHHRIAYEVSLAARPHRSAGTALSRRRFLIFGGRVDTRGG